MKNLSLLWVGITSSMQVFSQVVKRAACRRPHEGNVSPYRKKEAVQPRGGRQSGSCCYRLPINPFLSTEEKKDLQRVISVP